MPAVTVHVEGLDELQRRLAAVAERVGKNAQRAAVLAGAAVVRDEARKIAPVYHGDVAKGHPPPGTLRRSIILKHRPEFSNATQQNFIVTVRSGKKYQSQGRKGNLSQDAYYWKWVEMGHYARDQKTFVPAQPFMRPAFEAKKMQAIEAMKTRLASYLDNILRK